MSKQGLSEINRICQEINQMSDEELGKLFDAVANEPPDPFMEGRSILFLDDPKILRSITD